MGRRAPPPADPPAARRPWRWSSGVVGAVSRLDTALSAVRTVLTLRLAPVLLGRVRCGVADRRVPVVFVVAIGVVLRVLGSAI